MRLFIYPYNYRNQFLLLSMEEECRIAGIFTQENWKYDRQFVAEQGIQIYETLQIGQYLDQCDGVLFYPDGFMAGSQLRSGLLENMRLCLEHRKIVYCAMYLKDDEKRSLEEAAKIHHAQFHYLHTQYAVSGQDVWEDGLDICDTPMVYVGELCEDAGAKDLAAGISVQMKKRGYKVCGVLDDPCAELLGMHKTPDFLRADIREQEKVVRFNQYIKDLEMDIQPDLFVVQVPGSVYQHSRKILSDFGIYFFYYSQAFCPDLFFCVMPDNLCRQDVVEMVDKRTTVGYGYGLDGICRANLHLEAEAAFHGGYVDYRLLERYREVTELQCTVPVVRAGGQDCYRKFCDIIEGTLGRETIEIL